jgi:hypothetical protein
MGVPGGFGTFLWSFDKQFVLQTMTERIKKEADEDVLFRKIMLPYTGEKPSKADITEYLGECSSIWEPPLRYPRPEHLPRPKWLGESTAG